GVGPGSCAIDQEWSVSKQAEALFVTLATTYVRSKRIGCEVRDRACLVLEPAHKARRSFHDAARYFSTASAASFRTVFQLRAVPRVPSFCSIILTVSLE